MLTADLAALFARVALANVVREYPRHVGHLLTRAGEELAPRKLHPAFYGSYDWHSAVHMHWLLVHVLRLFPSQSAPIAAVLDRHLAPEPLGAELAYFNGAAGRTFERPYGWAGCSSFRPSCCGSGTQGGPARCSRLPPSWRGAWRAS